MMTLPLLNALACLAIAARLLLFRRGGGAYRPRAALLAWLLIVCAAATAIGLLSGRPAGLAQLGLNLTLLGALLGVRGNVVELFRRRDAADPAPLRLIRRQSWL